MTTESRPPSGEPMAGHRSLTAITLVAGSVGPATVGAVLIWSFFRWPVDAYGGVLLFFAALIATSLPYAVGWLRSVVAMLLALTALMGIAVELLDMALAWRILLSVAAVAAIAGLTWLSLRFGRIRRPHDAKDWRAAKSDTWPYPYY